MDSCKICNKKIYGYVLDAYRCRCGGVYCSEHKMTHRCSYDFVADNREKIKVNLPLILGQKIVKI